MSPAPAVMAAMPESTVVMTTELKATTVVPLLSSVADPPLMSVRAAGILVVLVHPSPVVPSSLVSAYLNPVVPSHLVSTLLSQVVLEVLQPSAALPIISVAVLCIWATHTATAPPEEAAAATDPP